MLNSVIFNFWQSLYFNILNSIINIKQDYLIFNFYKNIRILLQKNKRTVCTHITSVLTCWLYLLDLKFPSWTHEDIIHTAFRKFKRIPKGKGVSTSSNDLEDDHQYIICQYLLLSIGVSTTIFQLLNGWTPADSTQFTDNFSTLSWQNTTIFRLLAELTPTNE